mmetsp:Transcript_7222/g.17073  ORF Transcript_7222/g.17073 Transcript_7222/m.17073 type:complete len:300 (-) Transcript_7222:429-1328(-)
MRQVLLRAGQQKPRDPDKRYATQVVQYKRAEPLVSTGARHLYAVADVLREEQVATGVFHRADEEHDHTRGEKHGALEMENKIDELVLVRWPREDQHQQQEEEEEEAHAEDRKHGEGHQDVVNRVLHLAEEGLVVRQVVEEHARSYSQEPVAHSQEPVAAPVPEDSAELWPRCGAGSTVQVALRPPISQRNLDVALNLHFDVVPDSLHCRLDDGSDPRPHVRVAHGSVLDKFPHALQHVLAHWRGDVEELLHGQLLLLCPPSLEEWDFEALGTRHLLKTAQKPAVHKLLRGQGHARNQAL